MNYLNYSEFLNEKEIKFNETGFKPAPISPLLYDFQNVITKWAIRKGRAAIFADCGLGKTPIQLEWARQVAIKTEKPVLILAPLAVSKQTKREGVKFKTHVNICESQNDIVNGVNITNYEKLHKFNPSVFSGIVLDESSILKSYTGKFRTEIIESFMHTPYKLACTATPAPNDFIELGNHSEFLNILSRPEMLSTFFINDASNTGTWRLKRHGQNKFWEWLCSWAVMITKPSDLGFEDNKFILPKLNIIEKVIKYGKPLPGKLFTEKASTLNERRQARQLSIDEKVKYISKLASKNGDSWLIWCDLNNESAAASKSINGAVEIKGSDKIEFKEKSMMDFSSGKIRVLVTKPKIAGFGMNWQHCNNVIFMGLSDSYESYYQAVRRCWRFGQKNPVNAYLITTDVEGNIVDNVKRKENDANRMRSEMVKNMKDITKKEVYSLSSKKSEYKTNHKKGEGWELFLGDSVEVIKSIKEDSIGFSMFSPPFASLFTYTDSNRDMGNCRNKDEFFNQFNFLIPELKRVLMPGRLIAIHCMNLLATMTHDGFMGLHDFRGDIIRAFLQHGFIYHSEVCIWKDPLIQAVRTKVLSLAHKQVVKDSSRCGQGLADYIVVMRKPGENIEPISRQAGFTEYIGERESPKAKKTDIQKTNKFSHEIWQRYASPVWFDIRQTKVLSTTLARDERDEKHVCPLQLDTIERCLELWSNKFDKVLDPFVGIGSVVFSAAKMDRHGIGIELKESYFNQALKNMDLIKYQKSQLGLFKEL
jgi:DNA modification methylase